MTLPAAETDRLRALLEQITPGPWEAQDAGAGAGAGSVAGVVAGDRVVVEHDFVSSNNAEFIAAARNALPALLEERDALLAQVRRLEAEKANTVLMSLVDFGKLVGRAESAEADARRLDAEKAALAGELTVAREFRRLMVRQNPVGLETHWSECTDCSTATRCEHHERCLRECTPADLRDAAESRLRAREAEQAPSREEVQTALGALSRHTTHCGDCHDTHCYGYLTYDAVLDLLEARGWLRRPLPAGPPV